MGLFIHATFLCNKLLSVRKRLFKLHKMQITDPHYVIYE